MATEFKNLTQTLQQISGKLQSACAQQKYDLNISVQKVNKMLQQIAGLNQAIMEDMAATCDNSYFGPNGLLDERNILLPFNRSNIWKRVQAICHDARAPEEKATPACLIRLHKSTYNGIAAKAQLWIEQTYEQMLEEE